MLNDCVAAISSIGPKWIKLKKGLISYFLSLSLSPRLLYLCTFHYSVASPRWQGCNNFGQMLVNTSDKWNSPCCGSAGRLPTQREVTHTPTEERRSMSIPSTENASSIRKLYTPPQPGNKHQIVCRSFAFPHSLHIENTHTHIIMSEGAVYLTRWEFGSG